MRSSGGFEAWVAVARWFLCLRGGGLRGLLQCGVEGVRSGFEVHGQALSLSPSWARFFDVSFSAKKLLDVGKRSALVGLLTDG